MRCIGKGAESAVMFCGIMNRPPPPTKFTKLTNILLQAARETCEESMAEAVHKAVEKNDGGRDFAVVVDGSWQKRGFSSKNGVVTVTSVETDRKEKEIKTHRHSHGSSSWILGQRCLLVILYKPKNFFFTRKAHKILQISVETVRLGASDVFEKLCHFSSSSWKF
ncbi:uncharacterized protein NPIL_547721 [Nephila pilipes]|uniref:Mutator-like transposase domain-containing protein n=1 Tax=Nephila pilipes TaxID=299642 RepID=A0A8X6PQT4_NEPPI|nr:uncharacterized protein NPIL_547721 [Nephila pilipes]